jgi:hypothetical protein
MQEVDDIENKYKLQFITDDELKENAKEENWFLVSKILDMSLSDMTNYSIENKLSSLGIEILSKLYDLVNSRIINYYLETSSDIDKVLNIFVRINSGGTHLGYSDLLLSIATANWKNSNAREEINELLESINNISEGFKITKDFILKTALFLLNRDMKFKVANFTNEAMQDIEENWDKIKFALKEAFIFLAENGFYAKNMISNYPASIVAYFIFKYGTDLLDKSNQEIIKFINISMLKGLFSSNLDGVLSSLRKVIDSKKAFKLKDIDAQLPFNKKLSFNNQNIKSLLYVKDTQKSFLLILSVLYNRQSKYTPNVLFAKKFKLKYKDIPEDKFPQTILNYQLVDLTQSNKPFFEQDDFKNQLKDNFIDENIDIKDKMKLFENREKNMINFLKDKLKV